MKKLALLSMSSIFSVVVAVTSYADPQSTEKSNKMYNFESGPGYVDVSGTTTEYIKILLISPKNDKVWYKTNIKDGEFSKRIWLNDGNGNYKISVMENLHDKVYRFAKTFEVELQNMDEDDKYSMPGKDIESDNEKIIKLSQRLVEGLDSDYEKSIAIYNWLSKNIKYDLKKYSEMTKKNYEHDYGALATLQSKRGVCYDYATLYAALSRAAGLKTKVVAGDYKTKNWKMYHAWNEVYLSEKDTWVSLDTSMAYVFKKKYYDNLDFAKTYEKTEELG